MGFTSGKNPPSSASTQNWLWVFRVGTGFLLLASLLFLLGFFTKMWYDDNTVHYGLWRVCTGAVCEDIDTEDLPTYRIATQAFQCLAFAAYGLAPFLHFVFYCTKKEKGFGLRIRVFDITYGLGVLFHIASVLIYGLETSQSAHFSWSYEMTCASAAINAVGISIVAFARKRALHDFRFCSHTSKSKRSSRVGAAGGGSGHTRGSHRGYPQQQQQSPYGSNKQLVFGPRDRRQQAPGPSSSQANVNVTIHNSIYTGGPEPPRQQQYPPAPYAYSTQTSSQAAYPAQPYSQQVTFPYPPSTQSYSQGFPPASQSYPPPPQGLAQAEPSAPHDQTRHPTQPPQEDINALKTTELPPIRGANLNASGESDSVDSGKPPSYEDVVNTADNQIQ